MGADIWLDTEFVSGIEGHPGTRFIVRLNRPPEDVDRSFMAPPDESLSESKHEHCEGQPTLVTEQNSPPQMRTAAMNLPKSLSVLIVDDDTMIRKMFKRSVLRVAPGWQIEEACNGETALCLVDSQSFDVIFLDQYMASIEKQLLGSETARALRSKGVTSIICGLSANDMEQAFLEAGANVFMFKPFPCSKDALTKAIYDILERHGSKNNEKALMDC